MMGTPKEEAEERLTRTMNYTPNVEDILTYEQFTPDKRFPDVVRQRVDEMKLRDKELATNWSEGRGSRQQSKLRRKLEERNRERHQTNPFQKFVVPISIPEGTPVYAAMNEESGGLEKMMKELVMSMRRA
jgi:hypothetical protein